MNDTVAPQRVLTPEEMGAILGSPAQNPGPQMPGPPAQSVISPEEMGRILRQAPGPTLVAPGAAGASPTGPAERPGATDIMAMTARNFFDDLMAAFQRTSPIVKNLMGEMNYRPLGEVIESDTGPVYVGPDGKWVNVDPKANVILRDPDTQKMMVYARDPKTNETLGAVGRVLGFGALVNAPTRLPGGAGAPQSETMNAVRAFDEAGVDPSIAAASQSRGAGMVQKMLQNVPGASGPVASRAEKATAQTEAAVGNLAAGYGTAQDPEMLGRGVKKGAETFISAGERGKGMPATNVIRSPTRMTGFDRKAETLYNQLNGFFKADDPVSVGNSRDALTAALSRYQNKELGKQFVDPTLQAWANIIDRAQGQLSWNDLRQFRTDVGGMLKKPVIIADVDRAQLERLYGALSDDIRAAAASKGNNAVRAFDRANSYYRAGRQRIDESLAPILKADDGKVLSLIQGAGDTKRPDVSWLRAIQRSIDPDQWGDVSATILARLGTKVASQTDPLSASNFSPNTFLTNYSKLAPEAKTVLFSSPEMAEARPALDRLVKYVIGGQANVERLGNPSGTGRSVLTAAAGAGIYADPILGGLTLAGANVASRLLMSPTFTRWYAGTVNYPKISMATRLSQLEHLMRVDKDIAPQVRELIGALRASPEEQQPAP